MFSNDLIHETCDKREIFKCNVPDVIQKLIKYIQNIKSIRWYTVTYKEKTTSYTLYCPNNLAAKKHEMKVNLEILHGFIG